MQKWSYLSSIILLFVACAESPVKNMEEKALLKTGSWRMEMDLGENHILPFEIEINADGDQWDMLIFNDKEQIEVNELTWKGDSLWVQLPVFESEFVLERTSDTTLVGVWNNYYKGDDYAIPVKAMYSEKPRFKNATDNVAMGFSGKYEVTFSPNTEDASNAIGIFEQQGSVVTGTFATETGDYRHLAGNTIGNKLYLSTFDGSHAFLFEAEHTDSGLVGTFYSGTHWEEAWVAKKNDSVKLRNPNELTFIKEGYKGLSFSFPNTNGDTVSLTDERYKNKVVIAQIMGTWCPNCLDETKYLTALYKKYKEQGLEIVALAFERTSTTEKALNNIKRLKERTGAEYEFLLGGATRNDKAAEKLPMLNHIMSYPTAIFINKKGEVERIHTGFYGPSTGKYYTDFVKETEVLVEKLLAEKSNEI